jgi:hypothetical protein
MHDHRVRSAGIVLSVLVIALAACTAAGPGSAGTTPEASSPSATPTASDAPPSTTTPSGSTAPGGPTPTAIPGGSPAGSAEAAVAGVKARTPWFDGIHAKDASLIGQAAWWQVRGGPDDWLVTINVGWGDCQAGCIDHHQWTWHVAADGGITFGSESGSVLPADQLAALAASATVAGVGGSVTAGPTCPVERPGDPSCVPRPVAGAVLVVRSAAGAEVARFTTDASGLYRIALPPGDYSIEPQPVTGLMGTARPATFTVAAGALTSLAIAYDTGIR